ncbi:MAG: AbrB/MazE/SpoVT family DNA-binding domain-containing protein [Candidatus Aenigmarchaeota archaeon]|nr:AbrB/MazE/SpoVT family DNA-binding domain-containing protein [Candidatus Aenigmarchaeota archaeon]
MQEVEATTKKWGSSVGIVIPKDVLEKEKIKVGEKVHLFLRKPVDIKKSMKAWEDMQKAGKEISKRWKGPSAVEEIRQQRTKEW